MYRILSFLCFVGLLAAFAVVARNEGVRKLVDDASKIVLSENSAPSQQAIAPSPDNSESAVRATLQGLINSLNQHDFEEAYSYFDPSLRESFERFANFWRQYRVGSIKYTVNNIQKKGDGTYNATVSLDGDDMGGSIKTIRFSYELIPMNSKWQIVGFRRLRDNY